MVHVVSGSTKTLGILADPIHHVRTPQLMNRLLAERSLDALMVPFHVRSADLSSLVQALRTVHNLLGYIATVPHKVAMRVLCDQVTPLAAQVGAVNVVRRDKDGCLHGAMLDGPAFVAGLAECGIDVRGLNVYLAGAGGAASAIAFALADAGVATLTVTNRTIRKAADLAEKVARAYPAVRIRTASGDPSGHDLVVNGTSLGLDSADALPLDVAQLEPGQIVAEVIMQPAMTPLLLAAERRGCRIHPGAPMLTAQIALMADFIGVERAR